MIDLFAPRKGGLPIADRIDATGDCWEWTGVTSEGYGQVKIDGKMVLLHRLMWETLVGPIPDGLEIDHLCRNRLCCNPDHLETVTRSENWNRSPVTPPARRRRQTHCLNGHPLSGDNLYEPPKRPGRRHCRACAADRDKRRDRSSR